MPNISVIMSVYNEEVKLIEMAITSILKQTYKEFEFIIVLDNPNPDESVKEMLKKFCLLDDRIRIIQNNSNLGLAKSLNIGIEESSGNYIARMDADDISTPDRLEKELIFLKNENADIVSCLRKNINMKGEIIGESAPLNRATATTLKVSNCICHPGVLMKRDSVLRAGGYRNFKKSQDYDLWLRMLSLHMNIQVLNEYLIFYRVRENSISNKNLLEQYYTSEYQKKLFRERQRKGCDSFSESELKIFLDRKRITKGKIDRYSRARDLTNKAILKGRKRDLSLIFDLTKAFIIFPEVPVKTTLAFFKFT